MDFFPPPYSLPVIPSDVYIALCVTATMATISALTTFGTLVAVAYQHLQGHGNHADQLLIPILQLLLVDFIQAVGLSLSWHWARKGKIMAPTALCTLQGALINYGDVANALCILSIALETIYRYTHRRRPSLWVDYSIAFAIFCIACIMTIIGPIQHGKEYYVRTSVVCWVSQTYQLERLFFHYLYIFIAQIGTLVVYTYLIVIILLERSRIQRVIHGSSSSSSSRAMKRAACYMAIYPAVSLVLWFPLELERMLIWAGHEVSETHLLVGCVLISCVGWVNAIVYIVTRHVFRAERPGSTPSVRVEADAVLPARRSSVPGHGPNTMAMDQTSI